MKIEILMSKLFGYSSQTYFNWKKDEKNRPVISLLSKYFTKKDLEEFLESGKIQKMENIQHLDSFIFYISNIHITIIDKLCNINVSSNQLSLLIFKSIKDFKQDEQFSGYPDDVCDEFIDFVIKHFEKEELNTLLKICHKISKDTFFMYVNNIDLLDNYKFDDSYVYKDFIS